MTNKRGDLWIISSFSNEDIYKEIFPWESHTEGIIDFVKQNHLPLDIKPDDYHEGPVLLMNLGYMVVKSEVNSSLLIFYIPKIISENQRNWFLDHRYLEREFLKIGGYSLEKEVIQIEGYGNIFNEIKRKYVPDSEIKKK